MSDERALVSTQHVSNLEFGPSGREVVRGVSWRTKVKTCPFSATRCRIPRHCGAVCECTRRDRCSRLCVRGARARGAWRQAFSVRRHVMAVSVSGDGDKHAQAVDPNAIDQNHSGHLLGDGPAELRVPAPGGVTGTGGRYVRGLVPPGGRPSVRSGIRAPVRDLRLPAGSGGWRNHANGVTNARPPEERRQFLAE